jgi:hypothetical protein
VQLGHKAKPHGRRALFDTLITEIETKLTKLSEINDMVFIKYTLLNPDYIF